MAEWMGYPMYYAMDGAEPPLRAGAGHATIFPYGLYETVDGALLFGLQNRREWIAFCDVVLERPALGADPRFVDNAGRAAKKTEIEHVINAVLSKLSTTEAIERLQKAGIATASVNTMAQLWAHPQLQARSRWCEIKAPNGVLPALKPISGEAWSPRMDGVPALGEHSSAILAELGLSDKDIYELTEQQNEI